MSTEHNTQYTAPDDNLENDTQDINFYYNLEDRLSPIRGVLYGFQHLLLLLPTTVLAPLLLARGIHATPEITALLITGTLFASGIATMLQGLGILRVGARLPVVQGTELYFIPPLIAIGLNNGLGSIAFCVALGGFLIAVGSRYFKYISRLFPKLVIGTIITLIGVYLIPIGIDQFLGKNTPFFGTYKAFLVGSITFFITILGGFVFKGIWNSLSVLLGILSGYIVALFLGMVEFSAVEKASWFSLPHLFPFGLQIPNISSIILVIVLFIIAAIETTGYISATSELVGVQPTDKRVSRGLAADGIGSLISGLLGSIPMTAYAQNLGAIGITKVGSRYIAIYAGAITLLLGVVPKFGAAVSTIPAPVIGGALLILFGTIAGIGIQTLRPVLNTQRNLLIFATSLSLGVGFALAPDAGLEFMSSGGQVALQTGVAIGALAAIVLNLITPKQSDW